MGKNKKRNKSKKKAKSCPNNPIGKIKTKYIRGTLTTVELMDLCDRIQLNTNTILTSSNG